MITAIDDKTALILIDLQKGIIAYPSVHPISGVLEKAAQLVDAFREAGQPIVIVNVNPSGGWTRSRKDGTRPAGAFKDDFMQITHEIKSQPDDIFITKTTWGAFYETDLHEQLQQRGVTGIVIGGVSTCRGVEGTARQAFERGYNISFATDAMTDTVAAAHENSVSILFPSMGEVGTADEIITMLRKQQ